MESFEKFCWRNIIVIIAALLTLGGIFYAVKVQGENIKAQDAKIVDLFKYRVEMKVENAQTIVKLDTIVVDLREIKDDLKEIKKNMYRVKDDSGVATKIASTGFER
jgi:archaellum component FlaF (FlaF/FlaG flagellin family)